jgi:hypothetical protein
VPDRDNETAELSKRPVPVWTVIAAAARLDGDPERVITVRAKAKAPSETALDVALLAWALDQQKAEGAKGAHC